MLHFRNWSAALASCCVSMLVWSLLKRCFGRYGFAVAGSLLGCSSDFRAAEWLVVALAAGGAARAFWRNDARALGAVQSASLAAGFLMMLYQLGNAPWKKVDGRLALALVDAGSVLLCCYVCTVAQVALAFRRQMTRR